MEAAKKYRKPESDRNVNRQIEKKRITEDKGKPIKSKMYDNENREGGKYELMIKKAKEEEEENSESTWKKIRNALDKNKNFPPLKKMSETRGGIVFLEFNSEKDRTETLKIISKEKEIEAKVAERKSNPYVMVSGVNTGLEGKDIIKEIVKFNEELFKDIIEPENKMRTISKRPARIGRKENWIIETKPEVFKALNKAEKILIDYVMVPIKEVPIKEYVNVAICYKCCKFGHVAKYCNNKVICYECGKSHDGEQCRAEEKNCINCENRGLELRRHDASDIRCPIFKEKIREEKRKTKYE